MTDDHEQRTPVALSGLAANDPHLQPAARNPQIVERVISVCFIIGALLIAGFGACYWINAQPWKLGATMGGGFFFLGVGLVAWGKYLMPRGPFVEDRHTLANSDADREAFAAVIVERGGGVVKRRKMLGPVPTAAQSRTTP
jgi:ubiquinol-cytochrome c reductase iron-sulfur subunit